MRDRWKGSTGGAFTSPTRRWFRSLRADRDTLNQSGSKVQ